MLEKRLAVRLLQTPRATGLLPRLLLLLRPPHRLQIRGKLLLLLLLPRLLRARAGRHRSIRIARLIVPRLLLVGWRWRRKLVVGWRRRRRLNT
jgi:hypothetical protein